MPDTFRCLLVRAGLEELLAKYPGLRVVPRPQGLTMAGALTFVADPRGKERIADEYQIEIRIPSEFPRQIPLVWETRGRIPNSFHKIEGGALCLGSHTRLRLILSESPSMIRFVERCLIPYLYGYSYFERHGRMPFGELPHGEDGIRDDLAALFGTTRKDRMREFTRLAAMRRRIANKHPCPCGSGRRLGRCHHLRVNVLRTRLGRHWFRWVRDSLSDDPTSSPSTVA